jgi:hypothetical protein
MVEANMAFVGCIGGPWAVTAAQQEHGDANYYHPLQKLGVGSILPSSADYSNPHDLGGWQYAEAAGGDWFNAFASVSSATKVWYYFAMRRVKPSETDVDTYNLFYCHHDSALTPAEGHVMVRMVDAGATAKELWSMRIVQYDGATGWEDILGATTGNVFDCSNALPSNNPVYYLTIEIDMNPDPNTVSVWAGDATEMMNSGNPYFTADLDYDAVVSGTPCIFNEFSSGGKGGHDNTVEIYEVAVTDDTGSYDTTRRDYYGANNVSYDDPWHVFTRVPRADDPVLASDWTDANQADAGCSGAGHKWRTLDDPWDDQDGTDDHIYAAAANPDLDQWFTLNADYHDGNTPHIAGFNVVLGTHDTGSSATHILVRDPNGAGPTTDVDAGLDTIDGTKVFWRYGSSHPLSPDSDDWIHGTGAAGSFDDLQVGVRNSHATATKYCYALMVHTLLTNGAQPANASACPSAFRPHIMHYDLPIEYLPHIDGIPIGGCCT